MQKTIIDVVNATEETVSLSKAELENKQKLAEELLLRSEAEQAKIEAKEAARQSALDKLAALGLSVEEISAITGA